MRRRGDRRRGVRRRGDRRRGVRRVGRRLNSDVEGQADGGAVRVGGGPCELRLGEGGVGRSVEVMDVLLRLSADAVGQAWREAVLRQADAAGRFGQLEVDDPLADRPYMVGNGLRSERDCVRGRWGRSCGEDGGGGRHRAERLRVDAAPLGARDGERDCEGRQCDCGQRARQLSLHAALLLSERNDERWVTSSLPLTCMSGQVLPRACPRANRSYYTDFVTKSIGESNFG